MSSMSASVTIELTAEEVAKKGSLIGPKGSEIKGLEAQSGARIHIDGNSVKITGNDEEVAAASLLVKAILHPPSACLQIDGNHAGLLIGPKGSTLKRLQDESGGARIYVDGGAGTVTIEGASQDVVDKCVGLVKAIVQPPSATLPIDADHTGLLIGPKGSTLKRLQDESGGARIRVDGGAGTVTIEGATQAIVDQCVGLVKAIIQPKFEEIECSSVAASHVIGAQAANIKALREETGAHVTIIENGPACKVNC